MSESGKRIFTSSGISASLDTVLATTIGTNKLSNYKKSNTNLLISEKSLSNNSSKSSSGSSLTLTNNNNHNNNNNNSPSSNVFPHHQFYSSQSNIPVSTSSNWNNNISNSLCSQKVSIRSHCTIHLLYNLKIAGPCSSQLIAAVSIPIYWH